MVYKDALGRAGKRALFGKSEKLGVYWHLALELQPSVGKQNRFTALTHVVFTSEGKTLLPSASQQHRLRRGFCKQWWQDRWRDLISAYLARLSEQAGSLSIPLGPLRTVTISMMPQTFTIPVRANLEEPAAALESLHDDADMLFDKEAGDEVADEVDDEDTSGDPE